MNDQRSNDQVGAEHAAQSEPAETSRDGVRNSQQVQESGPYVSDVRVLADSEISYQRGRDDTRNLEPGVESDLADRILDRDDTRKKYTPVAPIELPLRQSDR